MSLIKCPSCGADVSTEAAACPKCGHPLKATPAGGLNLQDPVHLIAVIGLVVIVLVFLTRACAASSGL